MVRIHPGPSTRPALLHVTNGDSAAGTLRQTRLGGEVVAWRDVLHEGPVPAVARFELLRVRAAFLEACGWGTRDEILAGLEERDRAVVDALRGGVQVVLWFEHDLYDQLQLLDVLALAGEAGGAPPEAIVVDSFPGRPSFRGLGELSAEELGILWPARRPVTPEAMAAARDAWDAVRAPTPEPLAEWARRGSPELPLVAPALTRWLEELPAPGDGLSGTERRALRAIAAGAATPAAAFLAVQELEAAPFLGDAWFFRGLAALGQGPRRLLEMHDGDDADLAQLPVRLTEDGERVLRGDADRVELLGIDRWVGGTHVTRERLWRWDRTRGELVAPPSVG